MILQVKLDDDPVTSLVSFKPLIYTQSWHMNYNFTPIQIGRRRGNSPFTAKVEVQSRNAAVILIPVPLVETDSLARSSFIVQPSVICGFVNQAPYGSMTEERIAVIANIVSFL
jgi:hypothetical protein